MSDPQNKNPIDSSGSPWQKGDDMKNDFLKGSLEKSAEAASGSKISDLFNKDSSVYKDQNIPESPKEKAAPQAPQFDPEGFPIISKVHTYKEDISNVVKEESISLSKIAMMQEAGAKKAAAAPQTPLYKKPLFILLVATFVIVLGIGLVGGIVATYFGGNPVANQPVAEVPKERYIIYGEQKKVLNIANGTKTEIEASIEKEEGSFKEEKSVLEIIPAFGEGENAFRAATHDVFQVTGMRVPANLSRSLNEKFFLGLLSLKGRTDPFLVVFTSSFDTAYAGLLDWEGAMRDDFSWLFDTNIVREDGSLIDLTFKDRIIWSKDARSLEDADGKTAFFYTFLDQNTILFARTSDTVKEVMDRLRAAKFQ